MPWEQAASLYEVVTFRGNSAKGVLNLAWLSVVWSQEKVS